MNRCETCGMLVDAAGRVYGSGGGGSDGVASGGAIMSAGGGGFGRSAYGGGGGGGGLASGGAIAAGGNGVAGNGSAVGVRDLIEQAFIAGQKQGKAEAETDLVAWNQTVEIAKNFGGCLVKIYHQEDQLLPTLHAVPGDQFKTHAFPLTDTAALAQMRTLLLDVQAFLHPQRKSLEPETDRQALFNEVTKAIARANARD